VDVRPGHFGACARALRALHERFELLGDDLLDEPPLEIDRGEVERYAEGAHDGDAGCRECRGDAQS